MAMNRIMIFFFILIASLLLQVIFSTREPQFEEGDLIPLFANYVVPFANSIGNFHYELPFCPPGDPIPNRKRSLGEIVSGDCFIRTRYELKFKEGTVGKILCEKIFTKDEVKMFKLAIEKKSQYRMNFNKILFPTYLGFVYIAAYSTPEFYLVTHIDFYPQYYENQVVDIKSICDPYSAVDITEDAEIRVNFTYSVFWNDSIVKPKKSILQNGAAMNIKWWNSKEESGKITFFKPSTFWVLNLCLALVVLGVGLVATIPFTALTWRSRQNEVVRYLKTKISHSVRGPVEVGWHIPTYRSLLGAILGIGIHSWIMISGALEFGFPHSFYWLDLGSRTTVLLVYNLLCSYFAYDISSCYGERLLRRNDGSKDNDVPQIGIRKYLLMMLVVISLVEVTMKLVFGHEDVFIQLIFAVLIGAAHLFPWHIGARIAYSLQYRPPGRSGRKKKQEAPMLTQWQSRLLSIPAQMFLGGLLPCLAILIFASMDEIYASLISLKVCAIYSTMLSSILAATIMTVLLGAGFTIFQLHKKDYIWWWRSVLRGGSTAIFMFLYGIYFYYRVSRQIFSYEMYMFSVYSGCLCCVFFAVLGTAGFCASAFMSFLRRHR